MNCSQFDLKALFLRELGGTERAEAEKHIGVCAACREELDRLDATHTALLSLPEEEPPRRIAFVSDRVFELRWWQRLWRSGPALGCASAAMLSVAILVHAFARPAPAPVQPAAIRVDTAAFEAQVGAEVEKRLQAAVRKAVGEAEERQAVLVQKAVSTAKRDFDLRLAADRSIWQDELTALRKKINVTYLMANADLRGGQ